MLLANAARVLLGILLAGSMAKAGVTELVGSWKYSSQSCLSGATPDISLSQPDFMLAMTSTSMTVTTAKSECAVIAGPDAITVTDDEVIPLANKVPVEIKCLDGKSFNRETALQRFSYVVNGTKMRMTIEPFKVDGSVCPKGDSLIFDLDRAP